MVLWESRAGGSSGQVVKPHSRLAVVQFEVLLLLEWLLEISIVLMLSAQVDLTLIKCAWVQKFSAHALHALLFACVTITTPLFPKS